jgi:hypothetical protein
MRKGDSGDGAFPDAVDGIAAGAGHELGGIIVKGHRHHRIQTPVTGLETLLTCNQ